MTTRTAPVRVIVIEDDPSYGTLAAVRALRREGYEPWVAGDGNDTYATRSRYCGGKLALPDPRTDVNAWINALVESATRTRASVVLPGTERAMFMLTGKTERFPLDVAVGVCEPETISTATDKSKLAAFASEVGWDSPGKVIGRDEVQEAAVEIRYPAVVKVPHKVTATGDGQFTSASVQWVRDAVELRRAIDVLPGSRFLVQPYLGSSLQASCGVAWEGEVICVSHQAADRIFPPQVGISAYARTIPPDRELERGVERLIGLLGWSGIFELQLLRANGGRYLIDFNPHMYGSLALAVRAGLNLPAIWTQLLLGSRPTCGNYRVGIRYRNEERDVRALYAASVRGDWRTLAGGLLPRPKTVHAVFSARDPLPMLNSFRRLRDLPRKMADASRAARR